MNDFKNHLRKRTHVLQPGTAGPGPVIYWMQREQRVENNWALIAASEISENLGRELIVVFNFVDSFLSASERHYHFMIEGLKEAEAELAGLKIPFRVLTGDPAKTIPEFISEISAGYIVTDFNPLKIVRKWKAEITGNINIPFYEVDAHNIVPCRLASDKKEFGAYTIRPKIKRLLPEFSGNFPLLKKQNDNYFEYQPVNWENIWSRLKITKSPGKVSSFIPGRTAALNKLAGFLNHKIGDYAEKRNDPGLYAVSGLSPYLHFGQISSQEIMLKIKNHPLASIFAEEFLEELVIRKELSDNFCHYSEEYDSFPAFPAWAQKTLNDHRKDKREFTYSLSHFENGETHDELWNAAQKEMILKGKMHGYLRMYWAKKILEWTETPEEALEYCIYLNDKYELDGRDPNGYAGIAWSVGGIHDRAWSERPVFGKIRYMNYNGCKRKFDIKKYILSVEKL